MVDRLGYPKCIKGEMIVEGPVSVRASKKAIPIAIENTRYESLFCTTRYRGIRSGLC